MILNLSGTDLSVGDFLKGKINQKKLSEQERYVVNFLISWYNGQNEYEFSSSGSTGKPKSILLSKEQLEYSALATLQYLFGNNRPKKFLLCLDPQFIGGTQVIVRSVISNGNLTVNAPSANPLDNINQLIDLVSLVPLQVKTILQESPEKFNLIDTVLIGGAQLDFDLIQKLTQFKSTRFYQTYGMTETASHIAIKNIYDDAYHVLGDAQIDKDEQACLKIKGTVTKNEWIQTTDIIEMVSDGFKWIGRADWVINSGGIKFSAEGLERRILEVFPNAGFAISSCPDDRLGEKIVLVTQKTLLEEIEKSRSLSIYELPKDEIVIQEFPMTENGKLDRNKLKSWIREQT